MKPKDVPVGVWVAVYALAFAVLALDTLVWGAW
jgi:hypothetical protein